MALLKFLSTAFSQQPKSEKLLCRTIRDLKPRKIVQLGLGDGTRSLEIVNTACDQQPSIDFCGIDLFEASPVDQHHMPLRQAHRLLSALPAQIRLIPGDPSSALKRWANELTETDLLVISNTVTQFDTIWCFAPRMLIESSLVLIEADAELGWKVLTPTDIPPDKRRAAA